MMYKIFKSILIICIVMIYGSLHAQVISNNGASISISTYVSNASDINNTIGTISNNGTLSLTGNYSNNSITSGDGLYYISGNFTNNGTFSAGYSNVEMNGTTAKNINGSSITTFNNLNINKGTGSITVNSNVNIIGFLKANSGTLLSANNLILISTPSQTALIDGSGLGSITGNVIIQRYLATSGYKYLSSPFSNTLASSLLSYLSTTATINKIYSYDENKVSAGWTSYALSSTLLPMSGYAVNLGNITNVKNISISGSVNNGNISTSLFNNNQEYTLGMNLVGNPYPSPIDWNSISGWTKTNIDNAIYFFDASGASDEYSGTYYQYVNGIGTGGSTNIIPAMQGFFVHVSNGSYPVSGLLGMTNNIRTTNLNPTFKSASIDNRTILQFTLGFEGAKSSDTFILYFDQSSTLQFDSHLDALKIINTDVMIPNIYQVGADRQKLSISAVPLQDQIKINLGVKTSKNGWLNFNAKDISLLPSNLYIYLIDNERNITQNLKENPLYLFYLSGENTNRFHLVFSNSILDTNNTTEKIVNLSHLSNLNLVVVNLPSGESGNLQISDILGRVFFTKIVYGNETVSINLNRGIYIVSLQSGNNRQVEKIIIHY